MSSPLRPSLVVARRPIIPGFHPDPSVCRVGTDYFLINSSFEYSPAVPIFRSSDLRTWVQIGNVLERPDQFDATGVPPSGGIFAPTLRHHGGLFWMITTDTSGSGGQLIVTTTDPQIGWSAPVLVPDAVGIDPDLAWDEDGTCWLSWSGADGEGGHAIMQATLDPATGSLLDPPRAIWRGTGGQYPEGPHLYRIGGLWYLLIAEGGTERGHTVTVARGPRPDGPFEASPHNPLLTARSTDLPIQNTGHADFVQRPDGSWAMVFLAVRPRGMTPSWHVLGRETFATALEWHDGWPRLADPIEGCREESFTETISPTNQSLPPTWVAASRNRDEVTRLTGHGWAFGAPGAEGTFVGRRQEHSLITASADISDHAAGIELRVDPHHRVTVSRHGDKVRAVAIVGDLRVTLGEASAPPSADIEIQTVRSPEPVGTVRCGPDTIVAGFRDGTRFTELGRLDGRYLSTEVAGGFTGRLVGIVVESGEAVVTSFTYSAFRAPAE